MPKNIARIVAVVAGLLVCAFALTAKPFSPTTKTFFVVLAALVVGAIWRATKPAGDGKRTLVVCNPAEGKVFETHVDAGYGSSGESTPMGGFHVYFTDGDVVSPVEGELTYFGGGQAQVRAGDVLVIVKCPFSPTTVEPADGLRIGAQVKVGTPLMHVSWDRQAQMHVASVMLEHLGVGIDVLVDKVSVTVSDAPGVVAAGKPVMTVALDD